ncbi:MAG: periplasmic heavy metal sensor [Humidesulfovibrio sp.]|jgi:zinc resistance-associated protein|uniref:periplasmic heavy metal sensor n=1 Tax=Humidesulfovibrio sp. TaxID=2910988 RepID=UPI0027FFA223|nr:periplasmic heavy metal sensor [Humidesulfovibrio sp.]MDQ7836626.1 periplasmic heavy metal sensor [Humidesulfovibrio sp.]
MKTRMGILTLSLALVAVLGLAGMASAQGMMGQGMGGMGMMGGSGMGMMGQGMGMGGMYGMSPEKQAVIQKLYVEYNTATAPVRQQLFAKQSELNALYYGGTTDTKKFQTLTREIGDLNAKLYEAQMNLRNQLAKEGVPASGMGHGMGMMGGSGMGGMGMGMGGMGMGCW